MDTEQTPESKTLSTTKMTSSTWKRFLDRIRRRIAFVPSVDDTVKSLKDVGIELKDNQPWTHSPSILHRLSRFSWRIKYNQSSCNAGLQWLEAVRINNNHNKSNSSTYRSFFYRKSKALRTHRVTDDGEASHLHSREPFTSEKDEHNNIPACINYINALENPEFSTSEPLSLRSYDWSYWWHELRS